MMAHGRHMYQRCVRSARCAKLIAAQTTGTRSGRSGYARGFMSLHKVLVQLDMQSMCWCLTLKAPLWKP